METLCGRCGTPREDIKFKLCERCRLLAREGQARWRVAHRTKSRDGDTCRCGRLRDNGFSLCKSCRDSATKGNEKRRRAAKEAGLCLQCGKIPPEPGKSCCSSCREMFRDWRAKNPEKVKEMGRVTARRVREDVINAYGGKCACCGEFREEFLALDHVEGDGHKERKEAKGTNLYYRVRREGYPDRYRLLCHNCNFSLFRYGYCPHQKNDLAAKTG